MKYILLVTLMCFVHVLYSQKPALDFKAYDTWKRLEKEQISSNGKIISYELTVLKGNPVLHLYFPQTQKHDSILRANSALISSDESFIAWKMSPDYDSLRKQELNKVDKKKWDKDSLFILHLAQDTIYKFPKIKLVQLAEEAPVLAFLQEVTPKKVEAPTPKKFEKLCFWKKPETPKINPFKTDGNRLVVYTAGEQTFPFLDSITTFSLSPDGSKIAVIKQRKVKLDSMQVRIYQTKDLVLLKEFEAQPAVSELSWSANGLNLAFLYSPDTAAVKNFHLTLFDLQALKQLDFGDSTDFEKSPKDLFQQVATGRKPQFSNDSRYLYFGVRECVAFQKDTLLEREKVNIDIWHYQDLKIQPQQLLQKEQEIKRGNLYVYDLRNDRLTQLENDTLKVDIDLRQAAPFLLARNTKPYAIEAQWEAPSKTDYYRIDLSTGQTKLLGKGLGYAGELSADGRYFTYFVSEKQQWMLLEIDKESRICMNCGRKDIKWEEDLNGQPMAAGPVGFIGYSKEGKEVYFQSEYDIWAFDAISKKLVSLSNEVATKEKIALRYTPYFSDSAWVNLEEGYFIGLRKSNKNELLYFFENNTLQLKAEYAQRISGLAKAENSPQFLLRKMDVRTYPDLFFVSGGFDNGVQISVANPQQSQYNWATVETVKWKAYDGQELEGLLYKPENYDPSKKYPLLFYYYELNSDNLHNYQAPKPSASIINPTEYASGGYLVFIPDIRYQPGKPAQGAYNSIMSAADHLIKNFPIDEKRMGLQGQSWGGYQSAMLITMTTRFAAAMAGAPVGNMFSAYGGIRWGSGLNRQFQYESTQSRIGYTIWERPDLYVENSPLFHLPKVQTPLLIMANDKDGAVPWYQGIELYNGMRRLGKPCWMLNYNDDDHNLTKLANKYDLSIRMRQFFDHYLLEAPAPDWMTNGLPATDKGKRLGYE
jgi:dipeptidyl aminopeptidase/acylaminoacyl peptidase